MIPLLVICGPTASGKTALAVELARRNQGEVVSADSMQIYRNMNIGTAKPTVEEMEGIPHHMLDLLEPDEQFSVADYVKLAGEIIRDIHDRGMLPILTGGTGLYISSLVDHIHFSEMARDPALSEELQMLAKEKGNPYLWELLRQCDPQLAEKLHPNNLGRIIRGIEVFRITGTAMSELQRKARSSLSPYDTTMIGLTFSSRQILYNRIDMRVDNMIEQGLVEEARKYLECYSKTAAQAIGYKELFPYFRGEISLSQAVEKIKMETRRYAKRQLTWLRRDERIHWLNADEYANPSELADAADMILHLS